MKANRTRITGYALRIARVTMVMALISAVVMSEAGLAASKMTGGGGWYQSSEVMTSAQLQVDDDPFNDGPLDIPPDLPDPEPQCPAGSHVYTVDNDLLSGLLLLLSGSRLQISHTGRGEPIVGEPRTINLKRGIPAAKFEQLEQAQEARCSGQPNPGQCMVNWYQRMNETVVHTIVPKYHSYVDWSNTFGNLTGLSYTPVPVPVVEKSVQKKLTKALTSLLVLPIAVNVDRARCHVNQIESIVDYSNNSHPVEIRNGRLEIGFPLSGVGYPTLKCEGRAVALWGLHTWGWADELFPDVSLTNMRLGVSFGGFHSEENLPMYSFVHVNVDADIDLNNIPGFGEGMIDFFKDYEDRVRSKVADTLRDKLMSNTVREAFGRALVDLVEDRSGDVVERVCDVHAAGDTVDIEYETVSNVAPVPPRPEVRFPLLRWAY